MKKIVEEKLIEVEVIHNFYDEENELKLVTTTDKDNKPNIIKVTKERAERLKMLKIVKDVEKKEDESTKGIEIVEN